jgi:hypothetical protein
LQFPKIGTLAIDLFNSEEQPIVSTTTHSSPLRNVVVSAKQSLIYKLPVDNGSTSVEIPSINGYTSVFSKEPSLLIHNEAKQIASPVDQILEHPAEVERFGFFFFF